MTRLNRRRLITATAGAAGLAAIGPAVLSSSAASLQSDQAAEQTLRIVDRELPRTIGPQLGNLRVMLGNTFMPAFVADQTGTLQPGVCNEWSVSEDGLVYTLKIDPAATFSDGSPVTAADLKFTYDYLTRPETESWAPPYVTLMIEGYQEVLDGTSKEMSGLTIVDDRTLQITLSAPYTPFISQLAIHLGGIVQKANVEAGGATWDDAPVCVGPYMVESWNRDTAEIVWVRNPHWWRTAATIERVTYQRVEDGNTHVIMYENDEMDLFRPTDAVLGLVKRGEFADELHLNPYGGTYLFYVKATLAPMEDVNVRRALLKATDMGTIVQAVYEGTETPAFGVYPSTSDGYAARAPSYDPDGARAALAASTYGNAEAVPHITIAMPAEDAALIRVAEAMVQMWSDVLGISASVAPIADSTDPANETAQMTRTAQGAMVADPGSFATDLGLSTGLFLASLVQAKDDELDQLVNTANAMPIAQRDERVAIYHQVEDLIMDRAFYIPIMQVGVYYAIKPWVQGSVETNADLSLYNLPQLSIGAR